jgi:hypothetical protein
MNVRAALKGQYHAAMKMLKDAIEGCPDEMWTEGDDPVAFWRVAYHTLFYTHLYLMPDEKAFKPWEHHRRDCTFLGPLPWPPHREPDVGEPYPKAQVLDYWRMVDEMVDGCVDGLDLDAETCGFPWYDLPKLDHQINNIRHVQHHAALLSGRLRRAKSDGVGWAGSA